jgi:hypothetical protein
MVYAHPFIVLYPWQGTGKSVKQRIGMVYRQRLATYFEYQVYEVRDIQARFLRWGFLPGHSDLR